MKYAVYRYRIPVDIPDILVHPLRRQKEKALQEGFFVYADRRRRAVRGKSPRGLHGGIHPCDKADTADLDGRRHTGGGAIGVVVGFLNVIAKPINGTAATPKIANKTQDNRFVGMTAVI